MPLFSGMREMSVVGLRHSHFPVGPCTHKAFFLENLTKKKIEHGFSCRSSGKFPGATEHLNRKCFFFFFRTECFKRKFVYHLLKSIFVTNFRLPQLFLW